MGWLFLAFAEIGWHRAVRRFREVFAEHKGRHQERDIAGNRSEIARLYGIPEDTWDQWEGKA